MKQESGRSLIEIIGILAIAGVITAGAVAMYNQIRNRQIRTIATAELEQIVKNTRLLTSVYGDYSVVSVDYLIKAGALKNDKAPIGGQDWSIKSGLNNDEFVINLTGLSEGDCAYFTTVNLEWAESVQVNGHQEDAGSYCLSTGDNQVSFIIK